MCLQLPGGVGSRPTGFYSANNKHGRTSCRTLWSRRRRKQGRGSRRAVIRGASRGISHQAILWERRMARNRRPERQDCSAAPDVAFWQGFVASGCGGVGSSSKVATRACTGDGTPSHGAPTSVDRSWLRAATRLPRSEAAYRGGFWRRPSAWRRLDGLRGEFDGPGKSPCLITDVSLEGHVTRPSLYDIVPQAHPGFRPSGPLGGGVLPHPRIDPFGPVPGLGRLDDDHLRGPWLRPLWTRRF